MKYFSIPGYWTHFFEIQALLQYYNIHKEYFYPDRVISSFYDLPPHLIWNGGRVNLNKNSFLTIEEVMNFYNSLTDIHLCHVCTNEVLDKNMIQDFQCNEFIKKYYKQSDYIIFNSELLHKHLLQQIKSDKFIYSATIGLKDLDLINNYTKNNIVVLNYSYNNDNEYLKSLLYPQNIEIICGELCIDNCPNQFKHYRAYSKINAHIPLDQDESFYCKFRNHVVNGPIETLEKYFSFNHAITNERIDQLSDMGINIFKISGRDRPAELFFIFIVYYLILPKYKDEAYKDLMILLEKLKFKYKLTKQT